MADGQTIGMAGGVLARKLARARGDVASAGVGGFDMADLGQAADGLGDTASFDTSPRQQADPATRAWRLALARAARDQLKMTVGFSDISLRDVSLTEVLESPMQRALILMLQGRGEGMGLLIISGQMLAAMIEILTLTRLSPLVPDAADLRKPTRTDAAMSVEFVDAALAGFEAVLAESGASAAGNSAGDSGGGCDWGAGYRYAAFIDDPRPLHLMLEDGDYHLLTCDLALEDGARTGTITLALPHSGQPAALPDLPQLDFSFEQVEAAPLDDSFAADLANQVQELPLHLNANLTQISLPIERVMRLQVGEVLALPLADLDQISLLGLDGRRVAGARLGQNRGMRALRLTDVPQLRVAAPALHTNAAQAVPSAAPMPPAPALMRQGDALQDNPDFSNPNFGSNFPPFMGEGLAQSA